MRILLLPCKVILFKTSHVEEQGGTMFNIIAKFTRSGKESKTTKKINKVKTFVRKAFNFVAAKKLLFRILTTIVFAVVYLKLMDVSNQLNYEILKPIVTAIIGFIVLWVPFKKGVAQMTKEAKVAIADAKEDAKEEEA